MNKYIARGLGLIVFGGLMFLLTVYGGLAEEYGLMIVGLTGFFSSMFYALRNLILAVEPENRPSRKPYKKRSTKR